MDVRAAVAFKAGEPLAVTHVALQQTDDRFFRRRDPRRRAHCKHSVAQTTVDKLVRNADTVLRRRAKGLALLAPP